MLYMLFRLENTSYIINSKHVIDIFPKIQLIKIPHISSLYEGVINYGEEMIPVVDMNYLINNKPSSNLLHTRIILTEYEQAAKRVRVGLIAEKATETIIADPGNFAKSRLNIPSLPFITDVYLKGKDIFYLLEIDKLINYLFKGM